MKQYGTWDEKKDLKKGKMKSNKLIAEFMGYKLMSCSRGKAWDIGKSIPTKDHLLPIQGMLHTGNELKFHKSWDWLMPVVEKCMQTGDNTDEWDALYDALSTLNKTNIYQAVVEFIKELK